MSVSRKYSVAAFLAGVVIAAFVLWLDAGPAVATPKPQLARFKVEIKGVQQMYSQRTHEAEGACDVNDFSSGSEKLVFKTKPIVIMAYHSPGLYNPEFIAKSAPDGIPASATVTRSYTPRISGGTGDGCGENGGGSEGPPVLPDCGTKKISPFRLDLEYNDAQHDALTLTAGTDEDPYHECPGAGDMSFPYLLYTKGDDSLISANVSQDQLFDPAFGKWIALASGSKRWDGKDYWIKTTIHWDVAFTRLGH